MITPNAVFSVTKQSKISMLVRLVKIVLEKYVVKLDVDFIFSTYTAPRGPSCATVKASKGSTKQDTLLSP